MKATKIIIIPLVLIINLVVIARSGSTKKKPLLPYSLPESRSFKKALGYPEDVYLNFTELTAKYGYPTEDHTVVTEDGYILKVFRLVRGKQCRGPMKKTPVLLMHGLFSTSDAWLLPEPGKALAYILADSCYDVWAANQRGNFYSRKHQTLDPDTDKEFWKFSFEEHGLYDVPAVIDYILNQTRRQKLFYIGHSQGNTDFYVMASMKPEYNDKIALAINLAPIAWFKHVISRPLKIIASMTREINNVLETTGYREVFSKKQISYNLAEIICHLMSGALCGMGLSAFTGSQYGSISERAISLVIGHTSGQSSRSLAHLGQLINSGDFRRYDEGIKGNLKKYGSEKPPQYPVSKITAPVVLVCGKNDLMSSLKDVDTLAAKLPNLMEYYVVQDPTWSHNNHIWGNSAPKKVFSKILVYFSLFTS